MDNTQLLHFPNSPLPLVENNITRHSYWHYLAYPFIQNAEKVNRQKDIKKGVAKDLKKVFLVGIDKFLSKLFSCLLSILYICVQFWYKMTEEDKKLLSTFEARLRHFMYLHDELTRENARLKQLLAEKDEEIKQVENSRKELEAMYTNLKMARTISIHDNDIKDTKQRLSKLVREVDRCIALLKGQ